MLDLLNPRLKVSLVNLMLQLTKIIVTKPPTSNTSPVVTKINHLICHVPVRRKFSSSRLILITVCLCLGTRVKHIQMFHYPSSHSHSNKTIWRIFCQISTHLFVSILINRIARSHGYHVDCQKFNNPIRTRVKPTQYVPGSFQFVEFLCSKGLVEELIT